MKGTSFKATMAELLKYDLAAVDAIQVPRNLDYTINGLKIHENGHQCLICHYLTTSATKIKEHVSKKHDRRGKDRNSPDAWRPCLLQTFFAETKRIRYFVVVKRPDPTPLPLPLTIRHTATSFRRDKVIQGFKASMERREKQYETVNPPAHISEMTPWMKKTGFWKHIEGLNKKEIAESYALPTSEDLQLTVVLDSVERNLRKAIEAASDGDERKLNTVNACILNSFQPGTVNQKPFQVLQNEQSTKRYIRTWKHFICFLCRVMAEGALREDLFVVTEEQADWMTMVWRGANEQMKTIQAGEEVRERGCDSLEEMDEMTLKLCMSFIRHPLEFNPFDSGLVSFAAMLSLNNKTGNFLTVNDYTSYLSQITYCVQLCILRHCLKQKELGLVESMKVYLQEQCELWMCAGSESPMGELQSDRLYGMAIGKNEISRNVAIWTADGERVTYGSTTIGMDEIKKFFAAEVEKAQSLLYDELMFGEGNVRRLSAKYLEDDFGKKKPGWSFVDKHSNSKFLNPTALIQHFMDTPEVMAQMSYIAPDQDVVWEPAAIRKYEDTVQRFLESMLCLVHMGSGPPMRAPEILSTLWCNTNSPRSITLHDGLVMLKTSYHKNQQRARDSRRTVRFLPPVVGDMLVNYLAYVIPTRRYLLEETTESGYVSEHLWSSEKRPWKDERLSLCLAAASASARLPRLLTGSWRQIAVAIVKKKFSSTTGCDWDIGEDDEDEIDNQLVPFHLQSNHTSQTANHHYVNSHVFDGRFTDQAVQEYWKASEQWRIFFSLDVTRKRRRDSLALNDTPLMKKLKAGRPKAKKKYSLKTLEGCLRKLYNDEAATWLSEGQRDAMQTVLSDPAQLVVVMATGAGKSLLYMLPTLLPGSLVTILIIPLLALKQDTLRRCDKMGLSYALWHPDIGTNVPLVIVSAEQTGHDNFRAYLNKLYAMQRLGRIMVDEVQLVLTAAEYRPSLLLLRELREFTTPIVCLSASLPPTLMPKLEGRMLMPKPKVVRSCTDRPNLIYSVKKLDLEGEDFQRHVVEAVNVQKNMLKPEDKMIVYTQTTKEAELYAELLGCEAYYAKVQDGDSEEKLSMMNRWMLGEQRIIVATSALGAGIDHNHVRLVCHVGSPQTMIDMIQETGRAGRDGKPATSVVFLDAQWESLDLTAYHSMIPEEEKVMNRYLSTSGCRRNVILSYNDGKEKRCGEVQCDNCLSGSGTSASSGSGAIRAVSEELQQGRVLLRESNRVKIQSIERYRENLSAIQGICCLCRIENLPFDHSLTACKTTMKRRFFDAKKAAMQAGRSSKKRKGWFADYAGCYGCGNPQEICPSQGDKMQCDYPDIVFPLAYAVGKSKPWRDIIEPLTQGLRFETEGAYMTWLGDLVDLHGMQASNASRVADLVMSNFVERP
jgi:superfamily II DNA helicase RecQ